MYSKEEDMCFISICLLIRDLRIGNFRSSRITNRIGGYDLNSNLELNQGVVIYMFSADCHRSCVMCRPTAYYRELPYCMLYCNVIVKMINIK